MIKQSAIRMTVDISMTIFSLVLMGGNYFFPWTGVHEVLGAALFVLRGVHVALNRRWYASLAKGAYRPFRIMQAVVNCGILVCALFLMISGIMISQRIGLHAGMISRKIAAKSKRTTVGNQADGGQKVGVRRFVRFKSVALYVLLVAGCAYGLYAFISRGVWRYLILRQEFFFLDMEKGYALFFTDYIAIIVSLFCKAAEKT